MRDFVFEFFYRIISEILRSVWFLARPMFYLYLAWVTMKMVALYRWLWP